MLDIVQKETTVAAFCSCVTAIASVKNYLLNLNLFKLSPDNDERAAALQQRSNIIATRLFIVILVVVLLILGIYSWMSSQVIIVTLQKPTKEQVAALPPDASCPCSRISISYGEFISLQVSFHQVCSSDFISDRWIKAIYSGAESTYFYRSDFRSDGSAVFQALAGFCRLTKAIVHQSITALDTEILISPQALSEESLRSQIQASVDQFILTAPNAFGAQLYQIRGLTLIDQILSGLQTNVLEVMGYSYDPALIRDILFIFPFVTQADNSTCSCQRDLDCRTPSYIFSSLGTPLRLPTADVDVASSLMKIPGLVAGCFPVDSILLSTLECFYNQPCLNKLISFFPTTENFTAMRQLNQSRFLPNSTVQSIVDRLMVEEWITQISYERYYDQCTPILCTYSTVGPHGPLFALNKVISVLGSLILILGLIIPHTVHFIMKLAHKSEPAPRIPSKLLQFPTERPQKKAYPTIERRSSLYSDQESDLSVRSRKGFEAYTQKDFG